MRLKFLGTGTSQGIPVIGCKCAVCTSSDPRDNRLRCSALITTDDDEKFLIDCGPDFRYQMLRAGEDRVDAVLITHEHNDHIIGLDDLRPVIFNKNGNMKLYASQRVASQILQRFPYAFSEERYPGAPAFDLVEVTEDFTIGDTGIVPVEVVHSKLPVLGYRIGSLAYITDASFIPEASYVKLQNLDVLILNCLRLEKPHHSHFILPDILEINDRLKPKKMYLIHLSHEAGLHRHLAELLPPNVEAAYDGLEILF